MSSPPALSSLNAIGHVSSSIGLGVSARGVLQALAQRGCVLSVLDIDPSGGRHGHDRTFVDRTVRQWQDLPPQTNLWILPPPSLAALTPELQHLFLRPDCLNVAFTMWELPRLPALHKLVLEMFDVIVAPSDFIRYTIDFEVSGVRTVGAKQPIYIPADVRPDRQRFSLPDDATIFVFSFEPNSDIGRKNPFAVIEAFRASVGLDRRAHVVIKVNNPTWRGRELPAVQELRRQLTGLPRVTVIAETMQYGEVLSLYASCDVFVSLHRAEGLGLGMLEAMLLGKPVVATAWSGNMSFMNETNACLVGYRLIPVRGSTFQYQPPLVAEGTVWADPSPSEVAAWMRRLLDDPALRARKGEAARRAAIAYCASARECGFLDEIGEILAVTSPDQLRERRKDFPRRLALLRKLTEKKPVGVRLATRVRSEVQRHLDRHLLWRFRAQKPPS